MYIVFLFFQLPLELNGYGYDGYGTCTKPYRNARTKFPDLPCDFNTQSWCMVPGSTYPWYIPFTIIINYINIFIFISSIQIYAFRKEKPRIYKPKKYA